MKQHRIKLGSRVVVYDTKDGQPYYATRAYYMFRAFGHHGVSVLDGGMSKWIQDGRPTEKTKNAGTQEDYNYKLDPSQIKEYDEILLIEKKISDGKSDEQILDARPMKVHQAGHIQHAKNVFYQKLINTDNTLKSKSEIMEVLKSSGVDINKPLIASCNSGMTGSYLLAALQHIGAKATSLYDGSWSEYSAKQKAGK